VKGVLGLSLLIILTASGCDQPREAAQASMSPSRMFNAFTSEGGIRSPLIVKLPGVMHDAGTMPNSFVHVRDIMPTILDMTDVSHTEVFDGRTVRPMQGQSILDFLAGEAETPYPGAVE
jgi:arylsulfatase A-like enzyme